MYDVSCGGRSARPGGRLPNGRFAPSVHALDGTAALRTIAIRGVAVTTAARGVRLLTACMPASALASSLRGCRHRLEKADPLEGSGTPAPRLQPASLRDHARRRFRGRRGDTDDPPS